MCILPSGVLFVFLMLLVTVCTCHDKISTLKASALKKIAQNSVFISYIPLMQKTIFSPAKVHASSFKEEVAKSASFLPGMGVPNVFYPIELAGDWKIRSCITDFVGDTPTFRLVDSLKALKSMELEYNERYLSYEGNIVQDRKYSAASYARATLGDPDLSCSWLASNPNLLTIFTSTGESLEIRVTKRSIEQVPKQSQADFSFGYSEFAKVSVINTYDEYARPMIYGMRNLVRLRGADFDPENEKDTAEVGTLRRICGLSRMFVYSENSLDLNIGPDSKPVVSVKARFNMTKIG